MEHLTYLNYDGYEDRMEIYRFALRTWGADAQTLIMLEEMSELQKELCKHARGKDNQEAIAEEIADVQIMLEQMMVLHDCEQSVRKHKRYKLKRLAANLELPGHERMCRTCAHDDEDVYDG